MNQHILHNLNLFKTIYSEILSKQFIFSMKSSMKRGRLNLSRPGNEMTTSVRQYFCLVSPKIFRNKSK